jgi:hypothetical protein
MKNYRSLSLLVSFSLLLLVGCSGNVTTVGTIKFADGTPLSEGQILFQSAQHEFISVIRADGTYSMWGVREGDGLPPGTYNVFLRFFAEYLDEIPVDPKFVEPSTSGWTAEVEAGKRNRFDFVVEENPLPAGSIRRFQVPTAPPGR